jgi:glutaredoxin
MPVWPSPMTSPQQKKFTDTPQSSFEVTIYSRPGCHLCEEAIAAIAPLLAEFGATAREIDISNDATLEQRFGCEIPVIYIGRKKATKHRVNLQQFRRQLQDATSGQ